MASLIASSRPSLFSLNPKPLISPSLRRPPPSLSFPYAPRGSPRLTAPSALSGDPIEPRRIPIEDADPAAVAAEAEAGGVVDEWGERTEPEPEPEPEPPSEADPPTNDDEWGKEETGGDYFPGNGSRPSLAEDDRIADLKRCLVDSLYATDLGLNTTADVRAEIFELVNQLEASNPNPAPTEKPDLLDGNWILLYTAFSELLPLLAVGAIPLLKIKRISQEIDTKTSTIVNATTLSSPFATLSFSATASFEVRSPSRIQVQFKEGALQPPEISSTIDLPETVSVFGQSVDLSPVNQSLKPIQDAVAGISRSISGQPPLKVPIQGGGRAASWLIITYLDDDFRISRGDGGLFVLAKEGSPLIDQLS